MKKSPGEEAQTLVYEVHVFYSLSLSFHEYPPPRPVCVHWGTLRGVVGKVLPWSDWAAMEEPL